MAKAVTLPTVTVELHKVVKHSISMKVDRDNLKKKHPVSGVYIRKSALEAAGVDPDEVLEVEVSMKVTKIGKPSKKKSSDDDDDEEDEDDE
jgi:hypothetical protein